MKENLKKYLKKTSLVKWFLIKLKTRQNLIIEKTSSFMRYIKDQITIRDTQLVELKQRMDYLYFKSLHPDQYEENLKEWYKNKTGKSLDLTSPRTYNEKIQWSKLYDSTPLKTLLTDKYLVREWVREKIGDEYLIPLLGVYECFEDIDFKLLPNKFVIKTNHDSGTYKIVTDKDHFNYNNAKQFFDKKLKINFAFCYGLELHYKHIRPRILIEKYLSDENDKLNDYKFLCFDGEPKYVWVDIDRRTSHKRNFFDLNWKALDVSKQYPKSKTNPEKPKNLNEMIKLAKILSSGFSFVRVDLYNIKGKIYFGEMTFTDGSGVEKFSPEEFDLKLGGYIKLPEGKRFDF